MKQRRVRMALHSAALALGVVSYLAAPWPPVALAGGALALAAALADPWPAVLLLPLAAPFYGVPKGVPWLPFAAPELLALLVIAGGLVQLARAVPPLRTWRLGVWEVASGLFVGGAALATLTAYDPALAARELRVVVVEPAACGYVAYRCLREPGRHAWLAAALVLSGVLVALAAIQRGLAGDVVLAQGVARLAGPYGSPNHLALYLDRVAPLAAALAWLGPPAVRRWAGGALALLGAVALLTWSLGGWLALWVGSLVLLAAGGARRWAAGLAALSLALALALGLLLAADSPLPPERLRSYLDPETGTGLGRLGVWQAGLRMALAHPLLGVGPDNFRLHYAEYADEVWREPDLSHPHNLVLDAWLRAGLAGLAGYLALLALTLRAAVRRASGRPGWQRAVGAGVAAALAAGVTQGLVDRDYFAVDLAILFWLLWALAREDSA
ncbi:MAG: O-antigen ligase family protein [Chloroflexi bacterium]|nr:O-antigen ligase family protein [Chloroflexota bacterium]